MWQGAAASPGQEATNMMWHARRFYWAQLSVLQFDCLEWPLCYCTPLPRRWAPVDESTRSLFLSLLLSASWFQQLLRCIAVNSWISFSLSDKTESYPSIVLTCAIAFSYSDSTQKSRGVWSYCSNCACYDEGRMDRRQLRLLSSHKVGSIIQTTCSGKIV